LTNYKPLITNLLEFKVVAVIAHNGQVFAMAGQDCSVR